MMLFVQKPDTPQSMLQVVGDNAEFIIFRVSIIATTAFAFIRWVAIEAINSVDEIRRRKEETGERKGKHRK